MYRKTSPTSPLQKGTYEKYGIPYDEPIEWATPRLSSSHKSRKGTDEGGCVPIRNLMNENSYSEPTSLHLKHNTVPRSQEEAHVHPQPKPIQHISTSSTNEDLQTKALTQKATDSTLSMTGQQEIPYPNRNIHTQGGFPLRKWSSYSGVTNDGIEGGRADEGGKRTDQGGTRSYHGSVEHINRMYGTVPAGSTYQCGSLSAQLLAQGNVIYEQGYQNIPPGANATVAYVAPLRQDSSSQEGYATPKSASRSRTPSSSNSTDDGDKWDSILKAKDDLISQKDQIIERQKKTIAQLQHHQFNMDAKLQHALLVKSCDQDSVVTLKFQEYQYETAQLRAQLSQMATEKDKEIDRLQRKLGETEYLLDKMHACVKDTAALKDKDVDSLHNKLSEKDKLLSELKNKIEVSKQENLNVRRRLKGLERCLSDVPTTEEHQNTIKTLNEAREECSQLKDIISHKDRKLAQINKAYGNKSEEAKKFHKENKLLKEKVSSLETNLDKYKKNGPVSEIEFDDLKMENERLEAELNGMKKVLEGKHKKMKVLHAQLQKTQKGLEERLTQEEDTVLALRDEITSKEQTVQQLRKSLKELSSQNQDLMEQNLNLKTSCDQFQKAKLEESEKTEVSRKLWKELTKCVSDLKAIVQLCTARKKGEDPNMSLLLGLRGPSLGGDEFVEMQDDLAGLKSKIHKIQDIQREIDTLRTFVSDQYAEDVGNKCITQ